MVVPSRALPGQAPEMSSVSLRLLFWLTEGFPDCRVVMRVILRCIGKHLDTKNLITLSSAAVDQAGPTYMNWKIWRSLGRLGLNDSHISASRCGPPVRRRKKMRE